MSTGWIKIEVDARDAMRTLKGIEREQFPFAYAAALTETAKLAQIGVQQQTRRVFNLHSEYIPRGVLVQAAKKKDVTTMKMAWSMVYTSRAITPFMAWHETGGRKRPLGRALTIPGEGIENYSFKAARGSVKKRWKPVTLLAGYQGRNATGQQKRGRLSRKAFILPQKGGQPAMIARRIARGERGLEILYIFTPSAEIAATWGFERTVRTVANRVFVKVFEHKFAAAMQTAR